MHLPSTGRLVSIMRSIAILTLASVVACSAPAQPAPRAAHLTDSTFDGRIWVPKGFTVTEFASVPRARFMAMGPTVRCTSASRARTGHSPADANGDGVAEGQSVAVSGLDRPHGLAFRDGWLYIANTGAVVRVRLDGSGKATGQPETVAAYNTGGGHWTRTVIFGADGGMYVSIGSSCNLCVEKTPDRAAVMRYDADGTNGRVFSSGLRNAVGLAVHPTTGEIWVTQHERDNLRPDHENPRRRSTSSATARTMAGRTVMAIACRHPMTGSTTGGSAPPPCRRHSRCRHTPRR
jgi:glucose/arabinose dehydrogenase